MVTEATLSSILESFSGIYTTFTVAVIVLLFGIVLGKLAGKFTLRLLHELELNKLVKKTMRTSFPLEELVSSTLTYLIYFVFIVFALEELGLNPYLFNVIAAGIIAIVVISILLAIKDFIPNVIAGVVIHLSNHIDEGDVITVTDIVGTVMEVGVIETRMETKAGDTIYVPNSLLTKNIVAKRRKRTRKNK